MRARTTRSEIREKEAEEEEEGEVLCTNWKRSMGEIGCPELLPEEQQLSWCAKRGINNQVIRFN